MELIIIGFVIWYFYSKYFKSDTRTLIECPYCRKSLRVEEPGSYNCYSCKNMFHYKSDGQVLRGDETINEGLSILAVLFAKMAKADGVITENEIRAVTRIAKEDLELNSVQRTEFGNSFNSNKEIPRDSKQIASSLFSYFNEHTDVLEFIIHSLFTISDLDGERHPDQEQIIRDTVSTFYPRTRKTYKDFLHGNSRSESTSSHDAYSTNRSYEVLECDPTASDQMLKQAYRRLIQKYHPDKYQSKDLPEDMVEYGARRFMEIQEAYKEIKKQRNFV